MSLAEMGNFSNL